MADNPLSGHTAGSNDGLRDGDHILSPSLTNLYEGVHGNGILSALCSITDPYLNIFRGVIPPIGGFDISSLLAFLLLNFLEGQLYSLSFI